MTEKFIAATFYKEESSKFTAWIIHSPAPSLCCGHNCAIYRANGGRLTTCSCGGANPICFKCDGRGWIGEDTPKIVTLPPVRKELPETTPSQYGLGKQIHPRPVQPSLLHVSKVKRVTIKKAAEPNLKKREHESPPAPMPVNCPDCGASLTKGNLEKHQRKVHNSDSAARKKSAAETILAKKMADQTLVKCEVCNLDFKSKDIKDHKAQKHRLSKSLRLITRSGVKDKSVRKCSGCEYTKNVTWKFTESSAGTIYLCEICKPLAIKQTFSPEAQHKRQMAALRKTLRELRNRLKQSGPNDVNAGLIKQIADIEATLKRKPEPKRVWSPFLDGSFESNSR